MWRLIVLGVVLNILNISVAHAYLGPGLGLGALGVIMGILLSIILALVGVFWYPIKRLYKKYIRKSAPVSSDTTKGKNN